MCLTRKCIMPILIFLGVGVFHFNPYTYDNNGKKAYLQPGTEGQGLASYPTRKKYSLLQPFIPFGGGFKLNMGENLEVGFELGYRILFTDYLDDVSKTYPNMKALREGNGTEAVELSYRKQHHFPKRAKKEVIRPGGIIIFFAGLRLRLLSGEKGEFDINILMECQQ